MKIVATPFAGLLVVEPDWFQDERGFFLETYEESRYHEAGIAHKFVQDNQSRSRQGVLRGLHYQIERPQAQLVTVLRGRIFDVAIDLRTSSSTFGRWFGVELSDSKPARQVCIAPGFAHGFYVLSDWADLHYKVSRKYDPHDEGGLLWSDPDVAIAWPSLNPTIGDRDRKFPTIKELSTDRLPHEPPDET